MKAVILAGGLGTRISEETHLKPKPMIEIGGKPIIWHILKIYSFYGIEEFIICCGYKGYIIKEYFANYLLHANDVFIDTKNNKMEIIEKTSESWKISLVDTGESTMTGGRLKRIKEYINGETFLCTYGDGVSDININSLLQHHKNKGKLATLSAVKPPGRYGALEIKPDSSVSKFQEKPDGDGNWINGGFFVLDSQVLEYIDDDDTVLEQSPLKNLAKDNQLSAFKHSGYWQPMDTLRDKNILEELWKSDNAPWKVW